MYSLDFIAFMILLPGMKTINNDHIIKIITKGIGSDKRYIFGRSNDRDNNYFFKSSRPILDFRFLTSSTNLLTPGLDIK